MEENKDVGGYKKVGWSKLEWQMFDNLLSLANEEQIDMVVLRAITKKRDEKQKV